MNLSHWDPSPAFTEKVGPWLSAEPRFDAVNYTYSYTLTSAADVVRKLGFDPDVKACLVTPSGTTSMLCAINWVAAQSSRLALVSPFYFPVLYQARQRDIAVEQHSMRRENGRFLIPDDALASAASPLWLTNPVYCTGVRLHADDRRRLLEFMEAGGTVIADECLAPPGDELGRTLGHLPNFVGIYSPHKSLCLNGMKFSVVIFDRRHEAFFNQWADVLYGGLGASTVMAVSHYLSADFDRYGASFRAEVARSLDTVTKMAALCDSGVLDRDTVGHFVTFYVPRLAADLGTNQAFLWELVRATGAVVISGLRNHFDSAFGFCFRINLAMDDGNFRGALGRTMRFLAQNAATIGA